MKFRNLVPAAMVLCLALAGCGAPEYSAPVDVPVHTAVTQPPETTPPTQDPRELVESVTQVVTNDTIVELKDYPNLKRADLTGSTCYASILRYMDTHPEVEVIFSVELGGTQVPGDQESLTLEEGSYALETLKENLPYLRQISSLHLPGTTLSAEELAALGEQFPDIALFYTVEFLGREVTSDTQSLDLSDLKPDQVSQAAEALKKLPNVTFVELMTASGGSALSKADVKVLVDAAPGCIFHYVFRLYDQTIATNDEKVEFKKLDIGDDESVLREALDIMTGCKTFRLGNCSLSNEAMAKMREDYRHKGLTVAWQVWFGKDSRYTVMTDQEKIRAVYNVTDATCGPLQYCEGAKYIDMGHNDTLTDLSWVAGMPNLEILIISGCAAKDLTGFENAKKLEFLEAANCYKLEDVSALVNCESLRFLNISYTKVKDLMPLDGLPLERFVCLKPKVTPDEQEIFMAIHPDCWTRFLGSQPYGIGWRYDDNGKTYSEYYRKIRDIFGYDDMPVEPIPKK